MTRTNQAIAFFDFDGTITRKDSMIEFIKYAVGSARYLLGIIRLFPMLASYKLKYISNHEAKEKFIRHYFSGFDREAFKRIADEYSISQLDRIVRASAYSKIQWHKEQGHQIVIVSASLECWLMKWCERHGLDLIATQLEHDDGILTGKFSSRNCYGQEKVNRIQKKYTLADFQEIYAYGDSRGDREMLSIANHSYYRFFKG